MNCLREISTPEERFMARALDLAEAGRGHTAPNPCVGAVLVRGDEIVAEGWHREFGGPHAERNCLAHAREQGIDPQGLTMYVTLEPCNHHGKTPPCTEAIIEAGISRVYIGALDPNPVAAGGVERLREASVDVVSGILEQEALDIIDDFLTWQRTYSTYNFLKMATTLDGKIASRNRVPEAVSCHESFTAVHELRALVQAVVVGGETFRSDNPSLTCRLENMDDDELQPLAVVVTSKLPEEPLQYKLLRSRPEQVIFWTTNEVARTSRADALRSLGVSVWPLNDVDGQLHLSDGFERLRLEHGCFYTLCEGGGALAMSMVKQGVADEVVIFATPRILGDNAAPSAFSGRQGPSMSQAMGLRFVSLTHSGCDLRIVLKPDLLSTCS